MSHAAFLNAIRTAPEDDTARLVYADYLDEVGGAANSALAEFIRVQVALFRLSETDPQRPALEDRENELLRANEAAWLGDLPAGITNWKFERGFLAELQGGAAALTLDATSATFARHPITKLRISAESRPNDGCDRLATADWLPQIRELEIDNVSLSGTGVGALLTSPRLAELTALALTRVSDGPELDALLLKCPWFGTLKRFELVNWTRSGPRNRLAAALEHSGVEELRFSAAPIDLSALLTGKLADRLKRLEVETVTAAQWAELSGRGLKPALTHLGLRSLAPGAVTELLAAPACTNVVALDLNETRTPARTAEALARSAFWPRCRAFQMIRGKCPPRTMKVLTQLESAPHLRVLKLGETGLRDAGVEHLCAAPWADELTELDIMRNHLSDVACETIRDSGRLVNVRHLDVRTNGPKLAANISERITDGGLEALADAPSLARLRHLNAHSLPVGTRGAVALLISPHFRLAELDIGGTDITAETIRELARCPNLARLTRLSLSFVNGLTDDDLIPLAESEHLSPLCAVSAIYYRFSSRCREAMRARLGRRFLS